MAAISFTVSQKFSAPPQVVWEHMIDWPSHEAWIPATRIELHDGRAQAVGETFTGYTGYKKLSLVDRMRISEIDWDDSASAGSCEVEKLGPVLRGRAGFSVVPDDEGSRLDWFEDVTIPYVPGFVAPIISKLSALGFSSGLRRLASILDKS